MLNIKKSLVITLLASAISSAAFAASKEAPDRDLDDDGLIEINNWADLNEIRNNASGKLYGDNIGCPTAGCVGYELTADLDFDTNGNGKFDANDAYWNNGAGWDPLDTSNAVFEGNGHLIRNLIVNKQAAFGGLFGSVKNLHIRNLGLTGKLMSIEAVTYAGGFAGAMEGGSITGSFSTGRVTTTGNYAGGLVGTSYGTAFKAVFSSALVDGAINGGGLIGYADAASTIDSSYAVSKTSAAQPYQGLANGGTVTNSYWASDAKGDDTIITNTSTGATSGTLREMKIATSDYDLSQLYICPKDVICAKPLPNIFYVGWDKVKDTKGNAYWDFGTTAQLPGLVLNGVLYRDGDGNGILDTDESTSSSSSTSSVTASSSSSTASSAVGNIAPVIKVSGRWATQIWDDISHLDASATTDANGDALSFKWDFGNGKTAEGAVVSHIYYSSALYTPTLTVDDGHGGVSTMSWTVKAVDAYYIPPKSSSSTALSSTAATSSSAVSSSVASSVALASSAASASNSSSAPAEAKDSGGSADLLILVFLSSLGFAWRGKKAA